MYLIGRLHKSLGILGVGLYVLLLLVVASNTSLAQCEQINFGDLKEGKEITPVGELDLYCFYANEGAEIY